MVEPDVWWLLPLTISLLIGAICPATGALLITQRRVLLANLMAHSVLPGLVIALAIGIDPSIGGLISGLLGALVAERLNRRFKGREEGAMNTVLAGFTALGVLLVPLLEARVDLETILFGDLLAATTTDLLRTTISASALLAMLVWGYRDLVFVGIDPEGAAIAKRPVLLIRLICSLITALGVLLVPLLEARVDLETILFGDLLAATTTDLLRTALSTCALIAMVMWGYRDLVFVGIDPEGAAIAKRPVLLIRLICSLITALVVISAITAVGVILVIGLLCAPVLMHVERSRSLKELMLRSASTGLLLCGGGMMLAIAVDLPPGPLIGVLCMGLLMLCRP